MKTKRIKNLVLLLLLVAFFSPTIYAQSMYTIKESQDIDMKLSGTSTLHKWSMDAKTFTGKGEFDLKGKDQLTSVRSLTFALDVMDLKSGEKGLDKNAEKALKAAEYKDILYALKSATVGQEKDGKYLLTTQGDLTVAGVTKLVDMDVYCMINKDGTITCSGSEKLKMTDYQVKPPTFMLGAMKTGDDITLDFILVYKK
jgi:polyisoprenoid-binding protein YceI